MRSLVARGGTERSDRARLGGHGPWHVGQRPGPARDRGGGGAWRELGRTRADRRARGLRDFDLILAMDALQPARPAGAGAGRAAAREGAPAAGVRPGVGGRSRARRPGPLLRRRGRLRARSSTWSRAACRGLLERDPGRPPAVTLPPGAGEARRVGGGDINEAYRVTLAEAAPAFVKTRARGDPGRVRRRGGRPALARAAGCACAHRRCSRSPRSTSRSSGSRPGALSERAPRSWVGVWPITHLAGSEVFGVPRRRRGARRGVRLAAALQRARPGLARPSMRARRLLPLAELAAARGALSAPGARAVRRVE